VTLAEFLRVVAQTIATLVEGVGVAIVAVVASLTTARYLVAMVGCARPFPPAALRLGLGRSLALSLEFLLGADILRTAVKPSWDEIGRLAAIAAIRTALNFFLQREIASEAIMAAADVGGLATLPRLPRAPEPAEAKSDRGPRWGSPLTAPSGNRSQCQEFPA
jgi:uncharacterized membrane protein